jgi:nucleotide-binding universal stress UspA family protein
MCKHILIATDGSNFAQTAVVQGVKLAKQLGAKVSILTVTEPWWSGASGYFIPSQSVIQAYEKLADDGAAKITSFANETAKQEGLSCSVLHVKDRHPVDGIIEGAKANGCDLIVVGSRGHRALERFLLGSVASAVVSQSTIPVLICR